MDRSIIAPRKAEEKELCEKLFKKIKALMMIYPHSEDLRKCVKEDMFIRSNPQAFIQVMHFLFRLLDPNEFKKRFYWPITDKRGEANFRTSTVEYLKYLSEKHQLQWDIKSYLVVMPGGMKFITFLLDLVGFIVKELTHEREKQLAQDPEFAGVNLANVNWDRMRRKNEFLKQYASQFVAQMDEHIDNLQEKINLTRKEIEGISDATGISFDTLMSNEFQDTFEQELEELFQKNVEKPLDKIVAFQDDLINFKEHIDKFMSKQSEFKYDTDAIRKSLYEINKFFPSEENPDQGLFASPCKPELKTIVDAFVKIYPYIECTLKNASERKWPWAQQHVVEELRKLKDHIDHTKNQVLELKRKFGTNLSENFEGHQAATPMIQKTPIRFDILESRGNVTTNSTLVDKYIQTPPIKFEMFDNNRRLPLLDDLHLGAVDSTSSFGNFLNIPRSARKPTKQQNETYTDLNNTLNRSKIITPMQLLRTITKNDAYKLDNSSPQNNASNIVHTENEQHIVNSSVTIITPLKANVENKFSGAMLSVTPTSSTVVHGAGTSSPITPFNVNDITRISCGSHLKMQFSSDGRSPSTSTSTLFGKRLFAMKKVHEASVHNLSTSPSGRLDPLVHYGTFDTPKLKLNDLSFNSSNTELTITEETTPTIKNVEKPTEGDENNPNIANWFEKLQINSPEGNDSLFNISDSVLKDVIM